MKSRSLIWATLTVFALGGCATQENQRADKVGETVVGQAIARGKDSVCMDNLKQIRIAIQAAQGGEDQAPASLSDLRMPQSMLACPIGGEAYVYDATAGTVKCPHPGHGKY